MLKQKIKRIEKQIDLSANRRKKYLEAIKEYWLTGKNSFKGEREELTARDYVELVKWRIKMEEEGRLEKDKGSDAVSGKVKKPSEDN